MGNTCRPGATPLTHLDTLRATHPHRTPRYHPPPRARRRIVLSFRNDRTLGPTLTRAGTYHNTPPLERRKARLKPKTSAGERVNYRTRPRAGRGVWSKTPLTGCQGRYACAMGDTRPTPRDAAAWQQGRNSPATAQQQPRATICRARIIARVDP